MVIVAAAALCVAPVSMITWRASAQVAPHASSAKGDPGDGAKAMTLGDLDAILAPLGDADVATRRAAASAASELGADSVAASALKLAELRKASAAGVHGVMRAVSDGVQSKAKDFDLEGALLVQKGDPQGTRAALTYACLIRSLAHIGSLSAVRLLVLIAGDTSGDFRAELASQGKLLGDRAIAALIEARANPSRDAQYWASAMLDVLGKHLPSEAIQTKNYQALADILRAYGSVRDLDAVPVILSFVSSDRALVRTAARDALLAYGNDAAWKLREAYAALTDKQAPETWSAADLAEKLFAAFDKVRLQEVYAMLDDGLAAHAGKRFEEAVADFDKVLARQPLLDRRAEMAPAYVDYARATEDGNRDGALAALRKALRLNPAPIEAAQANSEIDYLEGEELLSRGIVEPQLFRRAMALDPSNTRAEAELGRLNASAEKNQTVWERWIALVALVAVTIAGVILFGGRRRRGSGPPTRSARAS